MSDSVMLSCPECLATNRVSRRRLSEAPRCGRCHAELFQGQPVEVDEAGFARLLANTELPLVVDFWASWCGPCKMMAPVFARAAADFEPRARFVKVNTETAQTLAARYAIRSIPTLLVIQAGREVARQSGALDPRALAQWLEQSLPD